MTTEVNTKEIASIASGFLQRSEQVRGAIASTMMMHPFAASAAMIAGQFAIEEAMTDSDRAFILKCVARKKVLIEGGKQPSDAAIFSVVAEAAAKQLLFGCDQYSVWSTGTLYMKEGGYRQLFKLREDCSHLDVSPGLPEWRVLKDKAMWVIPGEASVRCGGEIVSVKAVVGINGNSTDIIANIESKAARALLKRLWVKVSSIHMDDSEDQIEIIEETEPKRIQKQQETTSTPAAEPIPFAEQIESATKSRDLDTIARAIKAANLPDDEFAFYKAMVTEARRRLTETEDAR